MELMPGTLCLSCKYWYGDRETHVGDTCKAFPGGIPEKFLTNEFEHLESVQGDNGLTFERLTFE